MAALPRRSRFLAPVLPSSGVRRTFTLRLHADTHRPGPRDIHNKQTEYISDAAPRQRIGQVEYTQQSAEYNDVLQQEADLTALVGASGRNFRLSGGIESALGT
jgi:hypothetical protein